MGTNAHGTSPIQNRHEEPMNSTAAERHTPVMRDRITELLVPALQHEGAVVVDGTLGMGGHAEALLESAPECRLLGIDRDDEALALAGERLARFGDRFVAIKGVDGDLAALLTAHDLATEDSLDGAFFDLGVSSLQLDDAERGFAYRFDGPLDMRMDQSDGPTAADVLNSYAADDLTRVLRDFGEERFARKIANAVVRQRDRAPFTTSQQLVELLTHTIPAASQRTGGHPAKRTFQALRIEVNEELAGWQRAIHAAIRALKVGGRIVVLSYHSLEDRITKQALAEGATSSAPAGLPVELPEHAAYLKLLIKGAEQAGERERAENPRSASVRLRAAERIRPGGHRAPSTNRQSYASTTERGIQR